MKKLSLLFTLLVSAMSYATVTPETAQTFVPSDDNHFTGRGNFARLPVMPSNGDVAPSMVNFPPNVFTDWHAHSQGQYLIVTDGTGRYQEWGKPVQTIRKGDVVWVAPNVKHWHGAGEFTAMSHIAISPVKDNKVTWFEKAEPPKETAKTQHFDTAVLNEKQLSILPVAILVATGDSAKLNTALENALKAGLTVNELKEAISHQFSYIGAPKTLNGVTALQKLLAARAAQGIQDKQGKTATDLGKQDYYLRGTETMAELTHASTDRPIFRFAPAVDYALKSQLFGYQFSRDNLGYTEREIATLGSLVTQGEAVNGQLRSHLNVLKNLGVTQQGFEQLFAVIEQTMGKNVRQNAENVLTQIK